MTELSAEKIVAGTVSASKLVGGDLRLKRPKKSLWRRIVDAIPKPYLCFYLDLGVLAFRTHVMHHCYEGNYFEYITLDAHFLKWEGHFRLYRPNLNRYR